jgi:hypothetical protein
VAGKEVEKEKVVGVCVGGGWGDGGKGMRGGGERTIMSLSLLLCVSL